MFSYEMLHLMKNKNKEQNKNKQTKKDALVFFFSLFN